jgi:hypothetical protein
MRRHYPRHRRPPAVKPVSRFTSDQERDQYIAFWRQVAATTRARDGWIMRSLGRLVPGPEADRRET